MSVGYPGNVYFCEISEVELWCETSGVLVLYDISRVRSSSVTYLEFYDGSVTHPAFYSVLGSPGNSVSTDYRINIFVSATLFYLANRLG